MQRSGRRFIAAMLAGVLVAAGLAVGPTASPAGAQSGGPSVLVVYSDFDGYPQDVQSKLVGTGLIGSVDLFDAEDTTPTVGQLATYDSVLAFPGFVFDDASLLGDRLADYVDGGGRLVTGLANLCPSQITGRFASGGYDPFSGCSATQSGTPLTLVPAMADHELLAGVESFSGGALSIHADVAAAAGSTVVATWSNGVPLVAVKDAPEPSGSVVVGLNLYPPSEDADVGLWDAGTDGARLMANALAPGDVPPPPPHPANECSDVPRDVYYTAPFDWAWQTGVTTGVGGTNVCEPLRDVTRAEAVTILWRTMGSPQVATPHGFTDTVAGAYYQAALRWAAAEGHTTGVGGSDASPSTVFDPEGIVDRAQQFTFVWRLMGRPGGPQHPFTDVVPGSFYHLAASWAADTGVTTGYAGSDRFEPHIPVDRAQAFTIAFRSIG